MTARELIEERLKAIKDQYTSEQGGSETQQTMRMGMYHGARIELEYLLETMNTLEIE